MKPTHTFTLREPPNQAPPPKSTHFKLNHNSTFYRSTNHYPPLKMSHIHPNRSLAVVVVFTVAVLLCCTAATAAASVDCSTVISLTSRCSEFITFGGVDPGLGSPCCNGMASLHNIAAGSVDNREAICNCIVGLTTIFRPNVTTVARLPGLCGIPLDFNVAPDTDCNRYAY